MDIQRVDPLHPTQRTAHLAASQPETARPSAGDQPPSIPRAQRRLEALPEVRRALVAELRRRIADGTYEQPEKLQAAVECLLDDLG
jgi:anti-sigma28 factor (negative regulator of flagellin synthesis)